MHRYFRDAVWFIGFYAVVLLVMAFVQQQQPAASIDIGTSYSRPRLSNFYDDEGTEATYAYTQAKSSIHIPGVGAGNHTLMLAFNGWRASGVEPAQVVIGDEAHRVAFTARTVPAQYHVFLPASSGDVDLAIQTNTYQPSQIDVRQLGVPLDYVIARPLGSLIPLTTALWLGVLILACWLWCVRIDAAPSYSRVTIFGLLVIWLVAWLNARLFAVDALKPLVIAAVLSHILLAPTRWLLTRTAQRHALPLSQPTLRWVWVITGIAMLWKVGGILYPHIRLFDEAAHTKRVEWLLDGRFAELYFPNYTSFMGETVGIEGGYLPYSPLWYLVTAPFRLIGFPIGSTMNGLSALLDVFKGLLIFVLGLAVFRRERPALAAIVLYHLFPMPYYLLSWGNYPTQFGLWASLIAITFLVLNYESLMQRRRFWWWVAALALCIATYTVVGVLSWTMFVFVALFELVRGSRRVRGIIKAMMLGIAAAELIMIAIYHIHFVPVVLNNTVPALFNSVQNKDERVEKADDPRESPTLNLQANMIFLRNHTTDIMAIAMLIGIAALFVHQQTRQWWVLWASWLGIFIFYSAVSAFVADMVLKHIFFIMPLMCLGLAWLMEIVIERFKPMRWVVVAGMLALAAVMVDRWYFYIFIKRH